MIRKLAFALSLLGASYSGSVFSLGLGEATVKSNLNQPLEAEIELVSASEYGVEEILPGLATREEFLKANVDRVYFLSDIRFKVEKNDKGALVVVLTTNKPVREPFINFLVEVIWPSGRLLREYALLIDPPLFTEEPVAKVQPSSLVSNTRVGDSLTIEASVSESRSVGSVVQSTFGASYGPTQSHDTLWDIALKARPDRSVSPQQVMLAIQDLNPGAFLKGNINKLKAGQVLRLPTIDQIRARSQHQAIEEVISQNELLKGKRSKSIASSHSKAPLQIASSEPSPVKDELKLVVASSKDSNANSANSGASDSGAAGSSAANDEKLAITLEKLDKAEIEKNELSGRVSDLEEQLNTLQRLLTLKNDQLANIQAQIRANEMEKARELEQEKTVQDSAAGSVSLNIEEQKLQATVSSTDTVSGDNSKDEVVADNALSANDNSGVPTQPDQQAKAGTTPKLESVGVDVAGSKKLEEIADKNKEAGETSKPSGNIIETILNNPLYLAIAGVSIIGIVILLWFVSRNNAKREEEYQASLPEADDGSEFSDDEIAELEEGEAELESDFEEDYDNLPEGEHIDTSTDVESSSEDEDVMAEADVYIAYGRLDQAANVLENAVSKDPVNTEFRLKLLSVYRDGNDVEAFDRQFSELEAIQDQNSIDAANAMRSDMLDQDLVSLEEQEHSLELSRESQEVSSSLGQENLDIEAEAEALENEGQTFDFDSVELEDSEADLSLSEQVLEFDEAELGDVDLAVDELGEDSPLEMPGEELVEDDLVAGIDDIAEELSAELEDDFDDSILDVDLEDIDMTEELDQETEIELPQSLTEDAIVDSVSSSDEGSDITSSNEEAAESTSSDESLGDEDDFDFLEGTDEASTKLDLARAYIDMGDIEGAKDILEEVASEGNADQKAEASKLIESLG